MESSHLLYFKAIAEAESLTQAARALHISQPALSKSLANLEKELGRSLFNRVGGRLYLNSDGKALLEYANQISAIMDQIQTRFAQKDDADDSLTLYSIGNYFSFIMKNYFQYDTRALNLKLVPSAEIASALFSSDADVAIADDMYLQLDPKIGLKRIPILNEQLLLMVPHEHELAGRKSVELAELPQYPIMRLNTNFWIEELEESNHVKLNLPWSVDSATWNYYWGSYMGTIPLCFDTSASFVTHNMIRARKRRCEIVKVLGHNTKRMLYLWYFEKNEERLGKFLNCVRVSFLQ
mgnify:FL=1